jgi:acyl phosphate:glycerol-3-phosphate acyltransferase
VSNGHIVAAVLLGIAGYLLGAVPFGVLVGRWTKGVDIREHGSGNIGTTNAYRVLGARAGTVVLICDIAKGALPAVLAGHFFAPWLAVILATLPVIGHLRSIFLGGGGGKGAATGGGVVLGLMWPVFLLVLATFLLVLLTARMVSAASLVAAVVFPLVVWLTGQPLPYLIVSIVLGALVVIAHHANIRRILSGKEKRFNFSRHGRGDAASHGNADASRS